MTNVRALLAPGERGRSVRRKLGSQQGKVGACEHPAVRVDELLVVFGLATETLVQ